MAAALRVNIPNIISVSRILMLFVIVGLLYVPLHGAATVAFVLFIIGAATDWLDGYIARKYDIVSNFGKIIDALTDKIYVVGLFVSLLALNFLPKGSIFLILLIIGREFIVTGLRLVAASKGIILAAERMGKVKTVNQIITIGLFLFGNAMVKDFPEWVLEWMKPLGWVLGSICFFVTTYLTVSSGVSYVLKYWDLFVDSKGISDNKEN